MAASDVIPGSGFIFYSVSNLQWFTGFLGFNPAWVLRMRIGLSTSVDEIPLSDDKFQVYPNPSSDFVMADFNFDQAIGTGIKALQECGSNTVHGLRSYFGTIGTAADMEGVLKTGFTEPGGQTLAEFIIGIQPYRGHGENQTQAQG